MWPKKAKNLAQAAIISRSAGGETDEACPLSWPFQNFLRSLNPCQNRWNCLGLQQTASRSSLSTQTHQYDDAPFRHRKTSDARDPACFTSVPHSRNWRNRGGSFGVAPGVTSIRLLASWPRSNIGLSSLRREPSPQMQRRSPASLCPRRTALRRARMVERNPLHRLQLAKLRERKW
jgi:hypothetical protein